MSSEPPLDKLRYTLRELSHLRAASALLAWDQETYMPKGAIQGRADTLATIAGLSHDRFTAADIGEWLGHLEEDAPSLAETDQALVREVRRDYDKATKVPTSLVRELTEVSSQAQAAWQEARKEDSYADFEPYLIRLLGLKRQVADAVGYATLPFDAMLDDYEAGTTVADLETMFDELKSALTPLVSAIRDSKQLVDVGPFARPYPVDGQARFATLVANEMGFDFTGGRIDSSTHPFCTGIYSRDTRLTWRHSDSDLRPALYGIIHEAGHGLYEQGLPIAEVGTPLGEATSLGIHESQSRLWENMVARGRPFWSHFLPKLKEEFGSLVDDLDVESIYRASNEVTPSFIRVEADELTYNLHIILRFELERDLFSGALTTADLPEAWNDKMENLLGIRPDRPSEGVLQDIHWSFGAFGYFPTYTLGNLYAAQLYAAADKALGGLDDKIAKGDFAPLREWLRVNVHEHGRRYPARELVRVATGAEPSQAAFIDYVKRKFGDVYGL